jgi:glyceraldehyde 3-phosphate dehydrogenase
MRAAWEMPELEIVHVNEIKGGASTAAYMLQVIHYHINPLK